MALRSEFSGASSDSVAEGADLALGYTWPPGPGLPVGPIRRPGVIDAYGSEPQQELGRTHVIDSSARVHSSADLEADVVVGRGTSIWHRAQIRTGARIGEDCVIGRDVFIDEGVEIGDKVKIQNGALIYHGVTVEDGVFIGPGAILTNDRYPRAITATGDVARADDWIVSPIRLRHGASIGAGVVVVAGTEVGQFATVGAGAIVTRDVPAHALVVGSPARRIGWVCACGARLQDADGASASAKRAQYATNPRLHCPTCARMYVPDTESLVELPRPTEGMPA